MTTKVRIEMNDTQKILLKRYLNKNGEAQTKFTQEVAKESKNYIPFKTGRLKDSMIELKVNRIIYHAPYARKQYYSNKGLGRQGTALGGLRGKYWDKRMWSNKGDKIVQTIAKFCGGRSR